jgi:RimJ/RimL family protein N-acetyltransferase
MATQVQFDPKPVTLQGNVARLEPLSMGHAAGLLEAAASESIWTFLGTPMPANLEDAQAWIEGRLAEQTSGGRLPFAVISLADGNFAGSTGYSSINRQHHTVNIASWYGMDYQRTGVNTECKYLLLRHAFEELGARRVGLTVDVANTRSRRAVERIGAVQEGIVRKDRIRRDGSRRDTVVYGFIDDDWPLAKERLEGMMRR